MPGSVRACVRALPIRREWGEELFIHACMCLCINSIVLAHLFCVHIAIVNACLHASVDVVFLFFYDLLS